jgi:hypothetical protein
MEPEIMNNSAHLGAAPPALAAAWQKTIRRWSWLALPLAIVLLVPLLIPGYFAVPVEFGHCSVRQPLQASSDVNISLDSLQTQQGVDVAEGGRFCDGPDLPLRMHGSTTLDSDTHLWVVLVGERGQLYMQYPPVKIQNGQWSAENMWPHRDIRAIHFLRLSEPAHKAFSEHVTHNDWDPFAHLPADAEEVASLALEPFSQCTRFDARSCLR